MTLNSFYSKRFTALRNRLSMTPLTLTLVTLVFLFTVDNGTFWSIGVQVFSGHLLSFSGYMTAVFFLALAVFSFFAWPYVVKPFLAFMIVLSAITSYYMDQLGVIIDRDMIQNVMVTTLTESKHLITFGFVTHVLVIGIIPALILMSVRIKSQGKIRTVATPAVTVVISLVLTVGFLMADLKSYSSILRERKDFMLSLIHI